MITHCDRIFRVSKTSNAAFRLACHLSLCRFNGDFCTTAQAPLTTEGRPSGKQRLANKSITPPLCPQRQTTDSWILFKSGAMPLGDKAKAASSKLVWNQHKSFKEQVWSRQGENFDENLTIYSSKDSKQYSCKNLGWYKGKHTIFVPLAAHAPITAHQSYFNLKYVVLLKVYTGPWHSVPCVLSSFVSLVWKTETFQFLTCISKFYVTRWVTKLGKKLDLEL